MPQPTLYSFVSGYTKDIPVACLRPRDIKESNTLYITFLVALMSLCSGFKDDSHNLSSVNVIARTHVIQWLYQMVNGHKIWMKEYKWVFLKCIYYFGNKMMNRNEVFYDIIILLTKWFISKNVIGLSRHRDEYKILYTDGLVQDSSNSIANALEFLQSCTKPLICYVIPRLCIFWCKLHHSKWRTNTCESSWHFEC